jgi:hypothetical protein
MELNLLGGRRLARAAGMLRHLPASLCAATAGLSALPHHVVTISQALAVFGAAVADFGTHATYAGVQLGISQHEISRRLADLDTVKQQGKVLRLRMIAAFVQAVRQSLQANVVAIGHDLYVMIRMVSHTKHLLCFIEVRRNKYAYRRL